MNFWDMRMVSILNLRIVAGSPIRISDIMPKARPISAGKIEDIMRAPTYREIGVKIETTVSRNLLEKLTET